MSAIRIDTPGGSLVVASKVAERLLEAGRIQRNGDLYTAPDFAKARKDIGDVGMCDFCSSDDSNHLIPCPTFEYDFNDREGGQISLHTIGGAWAACDECYTLVQANERTKLLQRCVDHRADGKFTAAALSGLLKRFWQAREDLAEATGTAAAFIDYIEDNLQEFKPQTTPRDLRIKAIQRISGLNEKELEALQRGDITYKNVAKNLVAFNKRLDKGDVRRLLDKMGQDLKRPMPPGHIPHWQRALDARFEALAGVEAALRLADAGANVFHHPDAINLNDPNAVKAMLRKADVQKTLHGMGFKSDAKFLRAAETYSFNEDTIAAIQQAGESIPHDAPLSSIETPNTGAGWFWFTPGMNLRSSPVASEQTAGLLWGWHTQKVPNLAFNHEALRLSYTVASEEERTLLKSSDERQVLNMLNKILQQYPTLGDQAAKIAPREIDQAAIRFSTYVLDDKNGGVPGIGKVLPATKWYWPVDMSFHDMLGLAVRSYRESYSEGGRYSGAMGIELSGEEETLKVVAHMSLFFLAACVWFKQKILISAPGHIERHARKRYVKEHKLKDTPSVRVIALRASVREPAPPREPGAETTKREYHCRWIVKGHSRLQPCGPGRADRKLIWVDAYPKGPDDKPLKERQKVYAVIR